MSTTIKITMLVAVLILAGCARETCLKTYDVHRLARGEIDIDGKLDEPAWQKAQLEKSFNFPWSDKPAPLTEFRSLHDNESLYFSFAVHDPEILFNSKEQGEMALLTEDRVEIYFTPTSDLKKYFCFEIDSQGRHLDYSASFHRNFDFTWNCPDIRTAARRTEHGYIVEAAITLKALKAFGMLPLDSDKMLRVGLFRAEFSQSAGPAIEENWLSWISPAGVADPDFHVPGTFGCFYLLE